MNRFEGLWRKVVHPNIEDILVLATNGPLVEDLAVLTPPYCVEVQRAPNETSPAPQKCRFF